MMNKRKTRDIEERVKEIIADHVEGLDSAFIEIGKSFADYEIDSLDQIEIVMEIEEEFNIFISNDDNGKIQTVRGAINHVLNEHGYPSLDQPRIESENIDLRTHILRRICILTGGDSEFQHLSRWHSAKDALCDMLVQNAIFERKKLKDISLSLVVNLKDKELLVFYEIIVRNWTRQM